MIEKTTRMRDYREVRATATARAFAAVMLASGREGSHRFVKLAEGNLVKTSLRYSNGLTPRRLQLSIKLMIIAAVLPPSD